MGRSHFAISDGFSGIVVAGRFRQRRVQTYMVVEAGSVRGQSRRNRGAS